LMTLLTIVDESLCALLGEMLLPQVGKVVTATDVGEIQRILIERESPSIVLFDLNRQAELVEICREDRQEKIGFPLYMLALVNDDQLGDFIFAEGIDDYLRIPVCEHELGVRLRVATRILDLEMELTNTQKELRYTACHDPMTGLLNHNEIIDVLQRRLDLPETRGRSVSIVMMDLDSFKHTNDTYGHPSGDNVLCQTSQKLLDLTRPVDSVGRYGGDEFLIVLNNCNSEDAFQLAERIRTAVEEDLLAVLDDEVTITVSVGIATACQEDSNALDLIGKADTALYEAKKDGGNKVRVAEEKPSANLKLMGEGENAGRFTD